MFQSLACNVSTKSTSKPICNSRTIKNARFRYTLWFTQARNTKTGFFVRKQFSVRGKVDQRTNTKDSCYLLERVVNDTFFETRTVIKDGVLPPKYSSVKRLCFDRVRLTLAISVIFLVVRYQRPNNVLVLYFTISNIKQQ